MSVIASLIEPKADTTAKHPEQWFIDAVTGGKTSSGVKVSPSAALRISDVFACIRNIAEDVAKLPLKVYRTQPRGKKPLPDHPVHALLNKAPNDNMTAMSFRETIMAHAVGWHGGYAEIERDPRGEAVALNPIHPSRVTPGKLGKGVAYKVKNDDKGLEPVVIDARNMLHIHGLGPTGVYGHMLLDLAKESIGVAIAVRKFAASFFGNNTQLAGLLKHPGQLSDEAQTRLRTSWSEIYRDAWKPGILEEGMEWEQLGVEPEKAQFLQTRQFSVEDMARWFRMPPHKIQQLLRATFSNIEHQGMEYVVDTLLPWAIRAEQEFGRKLFFRNEDDLYLKHIFTALLRGDQVRRATFYRTMFNIGSLSQNDIRELEDQNPIPGGDVYYVPLNMKPSDQDAEEPAASDEDTDSGDESDPPPFSPPDRVDQIVSAHVPLFEDALRRVYLKQQKAAVRAAKKHAGDEPAFADWLKTFQAAQFNYLEKAITPPAWALVEVLVAPINRAAAYGAAAIVIDRVAYYYRQTVLGALFADFREGRIDSACAEQLDELPPRDARELAASLAEVALAAAAPEETH